MQKAAAVAGEPKPGARCVAVRGGSSPSVAWRHTRCFRPSGSGAVPAARKGELLGKARNSLQSSRRWNRCGGEPCCTRDRPQQSFLSFPLLSSPVLSCSFLSSLRLLPGSVWVGSQSASSPVTHVNVVPSPAHLSGSRALGVRGWTGPAPPLVFRKRANAEQSRAALCPAPPIITHSQSQIKTQPRQDSPALHPPRAPQRRTRQVKQASKQARMANLAKTVQGLDPVMR